MRASRMARSHGLRQVVDGAALVTPATRAQAVALGVEALLVCTSVQGRVSELRKDPARLRVCRTGSGSTPVCRDLVAERCVCSAGISALPSNLRSKNLDCRNEAA